MSTVSGRLYVDHNASSSLSEAARDAMRALLDAPIGNPGAIHKSGQRARSLVERARRSVAKRLGQSGGRLVFTSGATEANNLAFEAALQGPGAVITSRLEHPSVVACAERAQANGRALHFVSNDAQGRLELESLRGLLDAQPVALVSVMAANNELGNLNNISEIAAMCEVARSENTGAVALHIDAVQVFGRVPSPVPAAASFVTVSGHKFGGPKGVGALWVRGGGAARPILIGGHQERGWRAGTENVLAIHGFGAACDADHIPAWAALAAVRDRFEAEAQRFGAIVNGASESRLPNTSNVSFPGCDAEELLMALDLAGVECSAGSACTAGSVDVSPVIAALGLDDSRTRSALRFSFGPGHSEADALELARRVADVVKRCTRG